MICPKCKSNIPNDSKFCPDCGTPITNAEEIRSTAKDIISKYKYGYDFFVRSGAIPRFDLDSDIENCKKIIENSSIIINKHEEILFEKQCEVKQIHDSYKKGYDFYAAREIIPFYKLNYTSNDCDKILSYHSLIIQTHNDLVEEERKQKQCKVKHIHDSYKKGYDFYASREIIPYYKLNYTSNDCDKILSYRSIIIQKHNELVKEERKQKQKVAKFSEPTQGVCKQEQQSSTQGYDVYTLIGYVIAFIIGIAWVLLYFYA